MLQIYVRDVIALLLKEHIILNAVYSHSVHTNVVLLKNHLVVVGLIAVGILLHNSAIDSCRHDSQIPIHNEKLGIVELRSVRCFDRIQTSGDCVQNLK